MPNSKPVILMMAGGTGGHVFPALSVARELEQAGFAIHWLGTPRGIENDLIPKAGYPLHHIHIAGLRGKGVLGLVGAPLRIIKAVNAARKIIAQIKPVAAVGFGGYATGPGGVAAKLSAVPLLIHEQNAIAGMTNKLLRRISTVAMQAFPNALPNALTVGNPVRAEVAALPDPKQRFVESTAPLKVLVVGGSLGAVALNKVVLEAMALLPENARPQLRHQVGKANFEKVQADYQAAAVQADVLAFIDDMAAAYAWADLIICRAGALTVAEVAAAGCAALFVPFPHAVDDHQTANAKYLSEQGAAKLCQQSALSAADLAALWQHYSDQRHELLDMAVRARALAITSATQRVVEQVKGVCRG